MFWCSETQIFIWDILEMINDDDRENQDQVLFIYLLFSSEGNRVYKKDK